jgi:carbon storage regulator
VLVLSRKPGERIVLAEVVTVTVVQIERGRVRLGIEAPAAIPLRRQELAPRPVRKPIGAQTGGAGPREEC